MYFVMYEKDVLFLLGSDLANMQIHDKAISLAITNEK